MPRWRRVTWSIQGVSNPAANRIAQAIDTELQGKSFERIVRSNSRAGALVRGDYLFRTTPHADGVYATASTQLQGPDASSGNVSIHDCDHDAAEARTETGCVSINASSRGEPF